MGKRILLVDDTITVLMFEKMMLAGQGYDLQTASDGDEALSSVAKTQPDLILLDIMMPKMDGIETLKRLKDDPDTSHIPVVMVTTKGEPDLIEKAFQAGCDDYITKPLDKLELMTKINIYLD